jgi:hypothetical protein
MQAARLDLGQVQQQRGEELVRLAHRPEVGRKAQA